MKPADAALLFGAGIPLIAAIVAVAAARGAFSRDLLPGGSRKGAALVLLFGVLVLTVVLPAASGGRSIDVRMLRFPQVFLVQGILAAFLAGWWLVSGRPPLRRFLALESEHPLAEAGAGICLGLIGWALTVLFAVAVALAAGALGWKGPSSVPPLVKWIAALPVWKRALIVLCAATMEEFHFRAFLQRRFGAVAASILFVLAHGGYGEPFIFVGLVAITTVLAVTFRKTGSTIAPIFAHGTFDAVQLFVVLPTALKFLEAK